MSNYTKSTNFATKDNLPTGDPLKIVKGTEIDTEFNNIATAVATKTDNSAAAITGGTITGITDLAIADGGTGASTATAAINNLLPSQTSNANKYLQTDGTNVSWDAISINTGDITGTLPVANGGTGVTSSTGTGSVVLSNSPTLVTPSLGAATASTLDVSGNVTLSGGTASTVPYLNGSKVVTTGGALQFDGSNLGVGTSASYRVDLGSATSDDAAVGIRIGRGGSSTTWSLIDNVGGSGNYRQYSSGTPTLRWLTSTNGTSWSEQMRLNATGLGVGNNNPTEKLDVTGSALVSGSVTASQFYGSFNGAIGNTTAYSGVFTSLTTSSTVTINGGTANGVAYLNGSKVLTTGSVIKFDGTNFTSDRSASTAYSGTNQATWANGIVLNNSATPATGILDSIYFSNNANMQNVFGVAQNASGYGDFVWAGYSGTYTEWMKLTSSGLTLTSNPTLSGGTANGVTYLNGSKVLTSGSALTFDGTSFGIGTATPSNYSSAANNLVIAGTGQRGITIASTDSNQSNLFFADADSGSGEYAGYLAYIHSSDSLAFAANATEQMRLTSTGLGIGTSSPAYKLDVNGNVNIGSTSSVDTALFVKSSTVTGLVGAQSNYSAWSSGGLTTAMNIGTTTNNGISFGTNNIGRLNLDSAGNLGLGVTPSAWVSSAKALQIKNYAAFAQRDGTSDLILSWNATTSSGIASGTGYTYNVSGVAASSYEQNGSHRWYTAASGTAGNAISFTQAMTLDASGRLLVGNTTQVSNNSNANFWGPNRVTDSWGQLAVITTDAYGADVGGQIALGGAAGSSVYGNFGSIAGRKENATNNNYAGYLAFTTTTSAGTGTERARIDSSGNLLVGTTSSSASNTANGTVLSSTGGYIISRRSSGAAQTHIQFVNGGSTVGDISSTTTATTYATSSDYRLKNTIAPMTGALAKVALLKPCTYKWNADGSDGEGFIAHELAEVCPNAVNGEKDAVDEEGNPQYQGIDTSFLVATLTAAIQELKAEFDAYKASHP